jgi:hypothetical protein
MTGQPPPPPPKPITIKENGEEKKITSTQAPLKEAADLIQTLDIACVEMSNCAADAARDAETARKNARAASEIARRYLHRSFPKVQTPFGGFGSSVNMTPSPIRKYKRPPIVNTAEQKENSIVFYDDINEISQGLQTPRDNFLFNSVERRKGRRTYKTPISSERIAQTHAEDLLALSIELEKVKQSLKSERRMHQQTKTTLETSEAAKKALQESNDALETNRRKSKIKTDKLEEEIIRFNLRLEAAEEDAQLALELAKDSAEKRDEADEMLMQAREELRVLKTTKDPRRPNRSVRFEDTPPPPPPPPRPVLETSTATQRSASSTPRGMVAAGRQLLRRSTGTPNQEVITLELTPAKSAERRRRLRERLTQMDEDGIPTPRRLPSTPHPDAPPKNQKIVMDDFMGVAKILQQSGKKLDLTGHWWINPNKSPTQDFHLEAMTRQYCQSVEVSRGEMFNFVDAVFSAHAYTTCFPFHRSRLIGLRKISMN